MTYEYRAVGRRLAFDLSDPQVPVTQAEAVGVLEEAGFIVRDVNLEAVAAQAQRVVGHASYRRGAKLTEAPTAFDCSSLTRWLYAGIGVWLPRRTVQQAWFGSRVMGVAHVRTGDLLVTRGKHNYTNPEYETIEIGHIGFFDGTDVIHATSKADNVECTPLVDFLKRFKLQVIRRPVPHPTTTLTLGWDDDREIEVSSDVYYQRFRSAVS